MSYIKDMNKHDDYRNLYDNVEIAIVNLFASCEDKEVIEKFEKIVSDEMNKLSIYSEDNILRLKELKEILNKI